MTCCKTYGVYVYLVSKLTLIILQFQYLIFNKIVTRKFLKHLFLISLLSLVYGYLFIYMPNQNEKFTHAKLNNIVTKIKFSYMAGTSTRNYHLDNDIIITFNCKSNCILVGDSIVKESNTNVFKVYRSINGTYKFQNSYDANVIVE